MAEKIMEMKDSKKDNNYFLNVNWNDQSKNTHRLGFLGLYNDKFYFKIRSDSSAYEHGFKGMIGIQDDKIYVSSRDMFNILKKRLGLREGKKEKMEIMKELISKRMENEKNYSNQLTNTRDKLSFDEVTDTEEEKYIKEIDEVEKKSKDNIEADR